MAVNLSPPDPASLHSIAGIDLAVGMAGIKKPGRKDLFLMTLAPGAAVAGVFTRNRFCAAPVVVAETNLKRKSEIRALVVNTGNANAGTGADGLKRASEVCAAVARRIGCKADQVLPFSTGVIMEPLPAGRIVAALPGLKECDWATAAEAIMTTDTVPKAFSRKVKLRKGEASITGIAKGAGMIRPDMATMLGFIATDAGVSRKDLAGILKRAAELSFNCITVDGDTSTNDSLMLIATGKGPVAAKKDLAVLEEAITDVARALAQAVVRDGEGATKFVTVRVERGRSAAECRKVAYAIAHSPLVKTAFFASDPNLGRILAAIGYSGANVDAARVDLYIDNVLAARRGARNPAYVESEALDAMRKPEFTVRAVLNRGRAEATVWTCDFSFEYVKINAEYRT